MIIEMVKKNQVYVPGGIAQGPVNRGRVEKDFAFNIPKKRKLGFGFYVKEFFKGMFFGWLFGGIFNMFSGGGGLVVLPIVINKKEGK